MEVNALISLKL